MSEDEPAASAIVEKKWHHLCFDVNRSIRYHEKREAYFSRLNTISTAVSLIFGSGAVAGIVKQWDAVALISGSLVAITGLINLVSKSSEMARKHEALRQKWCEMQAGMHARKKTEENLSELLAERLQIEKTEPPIRRIVDLICYNEQLYADGYHPRDVDDREKFEDISWFKRVTSQIIDWDTTSISKLKPLPIAAEKGAETIP